MSAGLSVLWSLWTDSVSYCCNKRRRCVTVQPLIYTFPPLSLSPFLPILCILTSLSHLFFSCFPCKKMVGVVSCFLFLLPSSFISLFLSSSLIAYIPPSSFPLISQFLFSTFLLSSPASLSTTPSSLPIC